MTLTDQRTAMQTGRIKYALVAILSLLLTSSNAQVGFTLPSNTAAGNIVKLEYFIDTDPGFGNGNTLAVTPSADLVAPGSIPVTGLGNGVHRLYMRSRDAVGRWSHTQPNIFFIADLSMVLPSNSTPAAIAGVEYFIDTDPGTGNGIPVTTTAAPDVTLTPFPVMVTGLSNGTHRLYVRSKDVNGKWGHTNVKVFAIIDLSLTLPPNPATGNITQVEYYVDTDPGFGNGIPISLTAATDITLAGYPVMLGSLTAGIHQLYIRSRDALGRWGHTQVKIFAITNNITIPPSPAPRLVRKLEYFVDTDPGFGNGTIVTVSPVADLSNFSFMANIGNLPIGDHVFYIRSFDTWSLTNVYPFTVGGTVPLTLLSFTAQRLDNTIGLDWKTTNERNTKYFDVERSADGIAFTAIGRVPAQAGSLSEKTYHFTDDRFPAGLLWYRLRMVDADGRFVYSPIVRVNTGAGKTIGLYPNPATGSTTLEWPGVTGKNLAINLLNQQGQPVRQWLQKSAPHIQIDLHALPAGTYSISITDGTNNYNQQLVIRQ